MIVTTDGEDSMRQMKRKELERKFVAIEALYRRHREVQESGPIEDMKGECEAQILGVPFPLVQLKNFLNDDYPWRVSHKEQLRQEIVGDVSPCIGASNDSAIAPALGDLVAKINDMGLYAPWCVTDLTKKKVSPELEKLFEEAGAMF